MRQNTKRIPVKGTSRRIVIVRGDEDSLFEKVVYIVRDDRLAERGVTADRVLMEAIQAVQNETISERSDDESPLFSKLVLILVIIVFLLTASILLYLHFHGWS